MRQLFLHFFRTPKEDFIFKVFGPTHLLLIALMFLDVILSSNTVRKFATTLFCQKKLRMVFFIVYLSNNSFSTVGICSAASFLSPNPYPSTVVGWR